MLLSSPDWWINEERRKRNEAYRDDDVHADAHVHVPHEHASLCHSSLRFSINAHR
jgi:hypothetical protein